MFGVIGSLVQSAISGVISPLFTYLNRKQDVGLEQYRAATSAERDQYLAYVAALNQVNRAKVENNNWWGARLMVYLFGLPAALHWSAVFFVSTFPQWGWKVPALPDAYASAEQTIALSFFILAPALPLVSSVAGVLNRK